MLRRLESEGKQARRKSITETGEIGDLQGCVEIENRGRVIPRSLELF
jgi:hypothetical protein